MVYFNIDTTKFSQNSPVEGTITASVGNYSQSTLIKFNVTSNYIATLGIDQTHTYWKQWGADNIGGANTSKVHQSGPKLSHLEY